MMPTVRQLEQSSLLQLLFPVLHSPGFQLAIRSTSLPALTYASDRVTDVISVMSRQSLVQRVMSAVCLS
ncbi:unnamed protein product [Porites lobata]|uniref:Secreted protein n=1 Tax=Porites lobata TaxID=104759 RepID=A0ABN8RV56_9CNID|nr:unnamed protein product [Porites lobata]